MLKYHIQTIEVGASGASDLTFSNIPQIYDDLEVLISARNSSTQEHLVLTLNGSISNFTGRYVNNSPGSGVYARYLGNQTRAAYTANTFGNARAVISNYTSSLTKLISSETVAPNNATSTGSWSIVFASNNWASSSAITSLTLTSESGSNFAQYTTASLYGIKRGTDGVTGISPVATGGTVTTSGGYTYHTFTSSGTFVANRRLNVDTLIVGGGGGGGGNAAGGGGAGGFVAQSTSVVPATYTVTVGAGGNRGTGNNNDATSGGASSVFGVAALGGGRGAGNNVDGPAAADSGGSGGGGSANNNAGAAGTSGQGFSGGTGVYIPSPQVLSGGGGGGASAAGTNSSATANVGGNGGAGALWVNGSYYAGGGGGGRSVSGANTAAPGGIGGGGNGGYDSASPNSGVDATAGTANTGGGGGGAAWGSAENGGNGGSGVVIIRYLTPA
jgi:hypothetical protein